MNPAWGHVIGVITLVLMLIFIGIWIWAWDRRHAAKFDAMARLPMEDKPGQLDKTDDADKTDNEEQP